jgi:hypothetical protein
VNRETEATRRFHAATKYVAVPDGAGGERFAMGTPPEVEDAIWEEDRSIEPFPYKVYETLDPVPIPRDFPATAMPALEAIARTGAEPRGEATPDLAALARIALLSNGILKRGGAGRAARWSSTAPRAPPAPATTWSCTSRAAPVPGLDAGVYHYSAQDHSLRRVRAGDYRSVLVEATGGEAADRRRPGRAGVTSTFWRNAWRYKARAYRTPSGTPGRPWRTSSRWRPRLGCPRGSCSATPTPR